MRRPLVVVKLVVAMVLSTVGMVIGANIKASRQIAKIAQLAGMGKLKNNESDSLLVSDSCANIDAQHQLHARNGRLALGDSIIAFARKYMGTRYFWTGKSAKTGFDCSGFTYYVYKNFNIFISPGSSQQASEGKLVSRETAETGDLLIFTGTNPSIRRPGHVGIVISRRGETPIRFIHSSSNGGVKISEVENTRYERRLLQVRRVITPV